MKECIVTFIDLTGIRHSVEVRAASMYEAVAAALENFREHECLPPIGGVLEVHVRTAVTHSITVKKLQDWVALGGGSPREVILKRRIKTALPIHNPAEFPLKRH